MHSIVECCDHYCEKMRTYCESDQWVSKQIVQRAMDRVRAMAVALFDDEERRVSQAKRLEKTAEELEVLFAGEGLLDAEADDMNPTLACYGDGPDRFSTHPSKQSLAEGETVASKQREYIKHMKTELIDLEAAYLLRKDTVESLQRQIQMLEQSLPDEHDRKLL